jgi:hypothetical protein
LKVGSEFAEDREDFLAVFYCGIEVGRLDLWLDFLNEDGDELDFV